jgi:hypothetical protein
MAPCEQKYFFLLAGILKRVIGVGHVARMGEKRNAYGVLVEKPKGKRPLGRPRHGWVDTFKLDLRKIGWGCID